MAGNTLGKRAKFIYTSDSGQAYVMTLDEDLGTAAGLPQRDATNGGNAVRRPTRFKPRVVFVEATIEGEEEGDSYVARKELVVNATSALYNTNSAATVTIDGTEFTSTGRRGEKLSF